MLYIRHAQKAYNNGASEQFSLDPQLTEAGREASKAKFNYLVEHYGIPKKIICSPYLRARETAQIASEVILDLTGTKIEISCDPLIGEYLGHHKNKDINTCLHEETLIHNPIPQEHWKQYSSRVGKHVRAAKPNIWYITHGLVIQSIAFFNGTKIPYPSELEGIRIEGNNITLI